MNPYNQLRVNPAASLVNLIDTLKVFGDYSDAKSQELAHLLEGKNESEQREIVLDRLIKVKYNFLKMRKPEIDKNEEKELLEAYDMISTTEKRKDYEERRKYELGAKENGKQERDEISLIRELSQKRVKKFLEEQEPTKNVTSMEQLEIIKQKRKLKNDPNNEFPNYSGYSYRWGVRLNDKIEETYLQKINDRNEFVIVTRLGTFQWGGMISAPSESHPAGNVTVTMNDDIIGIAKVNSDNQIVRNDVMVAKLNPNDRFADNVFFINTFAADETIDYANSKNNGFMGGIAVREKSPGNSEYYINYNGIFCSELVSALGLAKYVKGIAVKEGENPKFASFAQIKQELGQMQLEYVEQLLKLEKTNMVARLDENRRERAE